MENFITVKREDGETITNPAERNIILLRYAAFLNENENTGINIQTIQTHQTQQIPIQIIEQPQQLTRKTTKAIIVQNAQATQAQQNNNQKVGG